VIKIINKSFLYRLVMHIYCLKYPNSKECSTKQVKQDNLKAVLDEAR